MAIIKSSNDKEKIINYCDSCYDDYIENEEFYDGSVILQ